MRLTVPVLMLSLPLAMLGCDEPVEEAPAEATSQRTDNEAEETAAAPAAERPEAEAPPEPEGPANPLGLPDELSAVLRREMLALEPAMADLQSHIARGRREEAAQTAMRIHDSFILKQELSQEQIQTLVSSVPQEFVHRDRAFHQSAASLAHAAEAGEMVEAARLYGEMANACVACHAEHASTRFPGLQGVSVPPLETPEAPEAPEGGEAGGHAH